MTDNKEQEKPVVFSKEQQAVISQMLKDSMKEHLTALFTDVTAYVDERVPAAQEESTPNEGNEAVSNRLKELEKQLQQEKDARNTEITERNRLTFTNKVRDELNQQGITAGTASELLTGRLFPSMSLADGNFISKDGKTVSELVTDFVAKEGADFRTKASGVGAASGDKPGVSTTKPDLESSLASFLGSW